MGILAVNAGSSSLKFSVHVRGSNGMREGLLVGAFTGLEPDGHPVLSWSDGGKRQQEVLPATGEQKVWAQALKRLQQLLSSCEHLPPIRAVAHRVVHGGTRFTSSVLINEDVMQALLALCSLAPLHQPANLAGIRAFTAAFAGVPQVACFDTAFHASMPELHQRFALPETFHQQGIRRYGFHGLSYQFIMGQLQQRSDRAQGRVLMAHLGNGASVCAAVQGRSVATSMGYSALDGLMMGTRSGTLDPGVVLELLAQGWDHDRIETLLYKQSGLLGVSGLSADMRTLHESQAPQAKRAVDLFVHRLVRESGAMVACMQGLDVLAFSGGIGEHDAQVRAQAVHQLRWLGVELDAQANAQARGDATVPIHAASSAVQVWVVPTDEGRVAAQEAADLLGLD